jgi:NTP pyrophosphatase (non-canonical NTP hydrolase)
VKVLDSVPHNNIPYKRRLNQLLVSNKGGYMDDIKEITEKIRKFRDERDWMQFHDPKNMAVSIILEASELLEHFQWKTTEEVERYARQNYAEIKDEIADIALYLFELADNLNISLINAMEDKLRKNEMRYPVEKAKGKHTKYNKL